MKTNTYQSPLCETLDIEQEGVLCASLNFDSQEFDDLGSLDME